MPWRRAGTGKVSGLRIVGSIGETLGATSTSPIRMGMS
jgi:hypothetical protein